MPSYRLQELYHDLGEGIPRLGTDELNDTPYASKYPGETLADRIQAAIDAGESGVRVARQDAEYLWHTNVQTPIEFSIWFDDYYQPVEFEGASGAGDADVALEPDRRLFLRGGWFETPQTAWDPNDRWTWLKPPADMSDSQIRVPEVGWFEEGVHLPGAGAVAWNNIQIDRLQECYRGVLIDRNGGYSNENRFRIGHGIYASDGLTTGDEILFYNKYGAQNSIIESDLGMANGTMVKVDQGGELRLHNVRLEDTTDNSTFFHTESSAAADYRTAIRLFGWNKSIDAEYASGKMNLADPSHLVIYGDDAYSVYHPGKGRSVQGGVATVQSQNDNPPALDTYEDYIRFRTGADSHYACAGMFHVAAEESSTPERHSSLWWGVATQGSTTVTQLSEEVAGGSSDGGSVDVNIRYDGGEHYVEVAATSGSGWSAAPDAVTVSALGFAKDMRPTNEIAL